MERGLTGLTGLTGYPYSPPIYRPEWGLRVKAVKGVNLCVKKCVEQFEYGVKGDKKIQKRVKIHRINTLFLLQNTISKNKKMRGIKHAC